MNDTPQPLPLQQLKADDFDINDLDDEIRVDRQCVALLRAFFQALTEEEGLPPLEAGELCHGADYFLREFIIGDRQDNLFRFPAERVRQFAGHWYIVRSLEPNLGELAAILAGVRLVYQFLAERQLVSVEFASSVAAACEELPFYRQRIDDFWAIEGDGFIAWRAACPLEAAPNR